MRVKTRLVLWTISIPLLLAGSLSTLAPFLAIDSSVRVGILLIGLACTFTKEFNTKDAFRLTAPLIYLAIFGLVSIAWTRDLSISAQRATLNAITAVLFFVLAARLTSDGIRRFITMSCALTCVVVFLASAPALVQSNPDFYFQGNFRGYFSNANSLAHYISSATLIYCVHIAITRPKLRLAMITACLYFAAVLLETRSRTAIAASLIGCLTLLILKSKASKKSTKFFYFAIALAPVLIAGQALVSLSAEKYEGLGTFATRLILWELHLSAIASSPLLGYGIGINPVDFKPVVDDKYNPLADTEKGNSYYVLPEELGIPISLWIYYNIGKMLLSIQHRKCASNPNAPLASAILFSSLFHGIFESWIFSFGNPMSIIFWASLVYLKSLHITKP